MNLKPCPFCGGKPFVNKCRDVKGNRFYSVKCHCGVLTRFHDRQHKVIEVWNRRAADEP